MHVTTECVYIIACILYIYVYGIRPIEDVGALLIILSCESPEWIEDAQLEGVSLSAEDTRHAMALALASARFLLGKHAYKYDMYGCMSTCTTSIYT